MLTLDAGGLGAAWTASTSGAPGWQPKGPVGRKNSIGVAKQPIQHNAYFLLRTALLMCLAFDVTNDLF